jgi:hypothetical protein
MVAALLLGLLQSWQQLQQLELALAGLLGSLTLLPTPLGEWARLDLTAYQDLVLITQQVGLRVLTVRLVRGLTWGCQQWERLHWQQQQWVVAAKTALHQMPRQGVCRRLR